MKRKNGYYWIKFKDSNNYQPGEWDDSVWWIIGSELWCKDEDIAEVGERIVRK